jgi:hypothetical protein
MAEVSREAFEAERDARVILGLAKKVARHVNKDTYIIGLDSQARLATSVFKRALGVYTEVPRTVHFLNFSARDKIVIDALQTSGYKAHEDDSSMNVRQGMGVPRGRKIVDSFRFSIRPEKNTALLERYIKKNVKIPRNANVLLVDEYAETGQSLQFLKQAFEKALGKKVITVALQTMEQKPIAGVDFRSDIKLFRNYWYRPVTNWPKPAMGVRGSLHPHKESRHVRKEMSVSSGEGAITVYRQERQLLFDAIRRLSKRPGFRRR